METTGTASTFTITVQDAVKPRSAVTADIVAVPFATAVTRPAGDTVATAALLVVQTTVLFVALDGEIVGVRVDVAGAFKVRVDRLRVTPVTGIPVFPP